MEQSNFNFLKLYQPKLYELAVSSEKYAYDDPQSAIVKLRCFAELYVGYIYEELSLPTYGAQTLFDKIDNAAFKNAVEKTIVEKLHAIRIKGNRAAHPQGVSIRDALTLIEETFFLAAWIYISFHSGTIESLPKYKKPKPLNQTNPNVDSHRLDETMAKKSRELELAQAELEQISRLQNEALEQLDRVNRKINQARAETVMQNSSKAKGSLQFESPSNRIEIKIDDIFSVYKLTDGQTELISLLEGFLNSEDQHIFLMKGYAGTGKTFITKGLTEYFRSIGRNYVLAAPTGKAAKVIANKTKSPAFTIHKTIYSFKDIKEYKVEDLEGSETYKYYSDLRVNEDSVDTVYIIDEASMMSDIYNEAEFFRFGSGFLLTDFIKYVNLDNNDHHKKVIFIGDDAQLPPVGMNKSPALDPQNLENKFGLTSWSYELTEVIRQEHDSGVMHNAIEIRESLRKKTFNHLDINLQFDDINHVEHEDLMNIYLDSCSHSINAESIIISYSNRDVAAFNKRIREEFFPGEASISSGDKIMAVNNSDAYGFFISNGDFGLVKKVASNPEKRCITLRRKSDTTNKVEEIQVDLQFRKIHAGFRDLEGVVHFFDSMIIENLLYSDKPNLTSDESKALYLDFCIRHPHLKRKSNEFKETLRSDPYFNALRVKFGYAITCHKAQGSEWPNVFVKCTTHQNQLSNEYFRWLYTAITRTSKMLYLLDEPHLKIGSGITFSIPSGLRDNHAVSSIKTEDNAEENKNVNMAPPTLQQIQEKEISGPEPDSFFETLKQDILNLISDDQIEISHIEHNNYQEAYIFARGPETSRLNISYNGKQKITSIILPQSSELGSYLLKKLNPLKGQKITIQKRQSAGQFTFDEDFLNEFHQRLKTVTSENGIEILEASPMQYCQRYTFTSKNKTLTIDIYYNKNKKFTRAVPQSVTNADPDLLNQVITIIENQLS